MSATLPQAPHEPSAPATPPPPPPRRSSGTVIVGVLLVVGGALWLLELTGVDVPWAAVLPAGLVVVGVTLMLGASRGAHGGLIGLGVVLTVFAGFFAAVDGPLSLGLGERNIRPATAVDLDSEYGLGLGSMWLDLAEVDLPTGSTLVELQVVMGELVVDVPDDVRVIVDASVVAGEIVTFDRSESGLDVSLDETVFGPESDTTLRLDLRVGFGTVEVR